MKTLYAGAGLALTAGLLLGAAMRPQLVTDARLGGPQTFAARAGTRAAAPTDDKLGYAGYSSRIPAYVVGTDAQRAAPDAVAEPPTPQAYPESYYVSPIGDEPSGPPAEIGEARDVVQGAQAEHIAYPSLDGGPAYDEDDRTERAPTLQTARTDPPPPEAAGDARASR